VTSAPAAPSAPGGAGEPRIAPPSEEDLLLAFLAQHDAGCPACGYSLLGAVSARCPECGCVARLALRPGRHSAWAFVAGLLPLAMGAGFGLLLLLWLGTVGFVSRATWGHDEWVFLTYGAGHLPPLLAWLALRRRVEAMRPTRGALLAGLVWGVCAGAFAALCASI
jgi:hypothetical protein